MLEEYIKEWGREYDVDPSRITVQYNTIDDKYMGLTTFSHSGALCIAKIDINKVFEDRALAAKCVLWHEFCHAELWVKEGKSDGHGDGWMKRHWRKPVLALLDYVYAKVLFAFLKK